MKLSTRGRYATRAMLDLALNYEQEPVVLSEVARRQQISERYLEQLINPLKVAGLIRSVRGPNGGNDCLTREVWLKATEAINNVFDSITLQGLMDRKAEEMLPSGSMRNI